MDDIGKQLQCYVHSIRPTYKDSVNLTLPFKCKYQIACISPKCCICILYLKFYHFEKLTYCIISILLKRVYTRNSKVNEIYLKQYFDFKAEASLIFKTALVNKVCLWV